MPLHVATAHLTLLPNKFVSPKPLWTWLCCADKSVTFYVFFRGPLNFVLHIESGFPLYNAGIR